MSIVVFFDIGAGSATALPFFLWILSKWEGFWDFALGLPKYPSFPPFLQSRETPLTP